MKRYLLFAGDSYYPGGGAADFIEDFESIDDAKAHHVRCDWFHIIDIHTGEVHETESVPRPVQHPHHSVSQYDTKWVIKPIREFCS